VVSKHNCHFGDRIQATELSGWGQVLKAGPNGVFLILMALSWIPQAIGSLVPTSRERAELNAIFEALIFDVEWVLKAICEFESAEDPKPKTVRGRKRKSNVEESAPKMDIKKARKTN
jgi:hypothetical protein